MRGPFCIGTISFFKIQVKFVTHFISFVPFFFFLIFNIMNSEKENKEERDEKKKSTRKSTQKRKSAAFISGTSYNHSSGGV